MTEERTEKIWLAVCQAELLEPADGPDRVWLCTLDDGHAGEHEAHGVGGRPLRVWSDPRQPPADDGRNTAERRDERAKWTRDLARILRDSTASPHAAAYALAADFLDATPTEEQS